MDFLDKENRSIMMDAILGSREREKFPYNNEKKEGE